MSRVAAGARVFNRYWDRWIWLAWIGLAVLLAREGNDLAIFAAFWAGLRVEQRFMIRRNRRQTEVHVHLDGKPFAKAVDQVVREVAKRQRVRRAALPTEDSQ